MIVKVKEGYQVLSEKGKNLGGPYKTLEEANKRLRQVEFFKHHKPKAPPKQELEISSQVGWGSPMLQVEADEVVNLDGPSAVAAYIQRAITQTRLPAGRLGRHRLTLGTEQDGRPPTSDIRGMNILIVGELQSGKSWATGLLGEQMIIKGYSLCIIDPEGDYGGLESLPGVVVLQASDQPPEMKDVARALQHFDLSVVLDLSCVHLKEKTEYLKAVLPMLAALRRTTGLPHRIVVDEAHYFLHEPNIKQLLDMELGAYTIVTYRPSDLHPDLLGAIDVVVAKRLTNVHEVQTLLAMAKNANVEPNATGILRELSTDEAVVATKERQLGRCKLLPRLASHARHRAQYFDFEVVPGQEFVFTDNGKPIDSPARPIFEGVRSVIAGRRSCPPWRLFAMDRKRLLRPSLGIRYSED